MSVLCEAGCSRWFKTVKAMNTHLATAKSCAWYLKGKIRDLGFDEEVLVSEISEERSPTGSPSDSDSSAEDDPDPDFEEPDLFHFIPDTQVSLPPDSEEAFNPDLAGREGGPGPSTAASYIRRLAGSHCQSRVFEEDEDSRVIETHQTAGRTIRRDPPPSMWGQDQDGDVRMEEPDASSSETEAEGWLHPFASELDWKIAQWAVKEGIGHGSFNRLLEIPGVSIFKLSL